MCVMCEGNPLVTVVILTTIFTALIPLGDSNITLRRPPGYQWNGSRVGVSITRTSQSETHEHNNNVGSLDPHSSPPSSALTADREKHASISLLETTVKKSRKLTTCHHVQWSDLNCLVGPIILDVDISQPVFQQLCPRLRGKFPSPTSCDLYVVCFARFLTINCCPSSQRFSPIQGKCVPSESYNCGDKNGISPKPKTVIELLTNHQVAFWLHHHSPISRPRQANLLQTQVQNENKLRVMKLRSIRQATEEDFCRPGEGIYPHPYSCHLYVHCAPGPGPGPGHSFARTFIRKCSAAPKLVFNPSLSICDWPSNVPECESPHLDHINHSHNSVSDNQDGNRSKLTSGPLGSLSSRPPSFPLILGPRDDERKTAKGVRTRDGGTRRGCVEGGDYVKPHHHYCNKFEICIRGKVHLESCRLPLMFNPATKICDFPENVDCQSGNLDLETKTKTTNGCDMGFDYITRHPDYCNKFIECENGMLHVKNCSLGTLYNPDISSCDDSSQVKCGEPISLEHDTDVNSYPGGNGGGRNSLESLRCTERVIRAHPEFCNKFVECEHGKVFVKNCGPGTVYNKEIQQCDWARNTRRSLQGACNIYQECISGIYRARKCHFPGSNYNPKMQECDNNYKCPSTNETVSRTTSAPPTTLMTATATTSQRTVNLSTSKINRSTPTQSTNDESEISRTIARLLPESTPQQYTTVKPLLNTPKETPTIIATTISEETSFPAVTSTYAPNKPEAQEITTAPIPIVTKSVTPTHAESPMPQTTLAPKITETLTEIETAATTTTTAPEITIPSVPNTTLGLQLDSKLESTTTMAETITQPQTTANRFSENTSPAFIKPLDTTMISEIIIETTDIFETKKPETAPFEITTIFKTTKPETTPFETTTIFETIKPETTISETTTTFETKIPRTPSYENTTIVTTFNFETKSPFETTIMPMMAPGILARENSTTGIDETAISDDTTISTASSKPTSDVSELTTTTTPDYDEVETPIS